MQTSPESKLTDWQPIETAPKGKAVILWAVTHINEDGAIGNWKMGTGFVRWDGDANTPADIWWEGYWLASYDILPTHWMPLPEPPSLAPAEGKES